MSKVCSNCGTKNKDSSRFCRNCATPLVMEITCPQCGASNQPQSRFCHLCATPLTSHGTLPTGMLAANTILAGRYMIVKRVGKGGMGAVYETTDTRIPGKRWAVKEMSDAAITDQLEKQQVQDAFLQEARLLATLSHPNLPKVTDFFTEDHKQYLVMEFVEGRTLEEVLESSFAPLPEAQVIEWGKQLCDVLEYLHSQKPPVIFRDLKPANIMLDKANKIKLIDFGIARLFKPGQAKDTTSFGTAGYAPPEQYGKGQTDARSDLYALGVVLHQLATRYDPTQTPFNLPLARNINPSLSAQFENVLMNAMEQDIRARYQSAVKMRQALVKCQAIPRTHAVKPTHKSASGVTKIAPQPQPIKVTATPPKQVAKSASAQSGKSTGIDTTPATWGKTFLAVIWLGGIFTIVNILVPHFVILSPALWAFPIILAFILTKRPGAMLMTSIIQSCGVAIGTGYFDFYTIMFAAFSGVASELLLLVIGQYKICKWWLIIAIALVQEIAYLVLLYILYQAFAFSWGSTLGAFLAGIAAFWVGRAMRKC